MARINDTSEYPTVTPQSDDLLLGTDISDTAVDPNGAVKTFNALTIAQLNGKGIRAIGHQHDGTTYSSTTTAAPGAQAYRFDVTPTAANTSLMGIFLVRGQSSDTSSANDAGLETELFYYSGSSYVSVPTSHRQLGLWAASGFSGAAVYRQTHHHPFILTSAERRSDTGIWQMRVYYANVYSGSTATMYDGELWYWEIEE